MSTPIDEILDDEPSTNSSIRLHIILILFLGFFVARMWVQNFDQLIATYITEPKHFVLLTIFLTIVLALLLREYRLVRV